MNRWDSPLFAVIAEDEEPPFDSIWEAIIGNDGAQKVVRPIQATVLVSCVKRGPFVDVVSGVLYQKRHVIIYADSLMAPRKQQLRRITSMLSIRLRLM